MKNILIVAWVILVPLAIFAQNLPNAGTVSGSFQIDAQLYRPDAVLGINDSTIGGRKLGINGFGNITYTLGNFKAGMRYEAFLLPMAGFNPYQEGNGFPHIWASYSNKLAEFTVGSFYEQFGNGLILRSYEEWTLGYDNALNGMRVVLHPSKGITVKGVYGSQRYFWQKFERNSRGIVRGLDAEINLNEAVAKLETSPLQISAGASVVSKYQRDADPIYILPENVGSFAGRLNISAGNFAFASEYAYKINDPSAQNNYIYKEGKALLSSLSYAQKGLGIVLQLKRVDNMGFKSDRSNVANALDINFLPPINRTHSYSLTAKYPYATQVNGEMGVQLQLNYKIPKGHLLGGKYGTSLAFNFSQVNDIVRNKVNDTTEINKDGTLGYNSPFFKASKHIFFRDINFELDKRISPRLKGVFQYMNLSYDIATFEGKPGKPIVNAHVFVADLTYLLRNSHSIRSEIQGLLTKQDKGNWVAMMVEYSMAPHWFFAMADQYNYGNPNKSNRDHYYTFSTGYTHESTRIALSFGRQSEGVVCVGGVCRQVPASSGLTLTLTSSF